MLFQLQYPFLSSLVVLPYRLEAEGVRLHYGVLADGYIPYAAIEDVAREQRKTPKKPQSLALEPGKAIAYFGVDGKTDVTLRPRASADARRASDASGHIGLCGCR